jgi:(4S)-4-hydroxy-5-phosphonooxypentane-2,3-dione isomerase
LSLRGRAADRGNPAIISVGLLRRSAPRNDKQGIHCLFRPRRFGWCRSRNAMDKSYIRSIHQTPMLIVHVHVHAKAEHVDAFKAASIANARASVREPGIARFDVIQQSDDATCFVLVEVYRTPEAATAHKETAHYALWRDTVATMMAAPRSSVKFTNVFPDDAGW